MNRRKGEDNMFKFLLGFFVGGYCASKFIPALSEQMEQIKENTLQTIASQEMMEQMINDTLMDYYRKGELEDKLYELTGIRLVITPAIEASSTTVQPNIINITPAA